MSSVNTQFVSNGPTTMGRQDNLASGLERVAARIREILSAAPVEQIVHHCHGLFRHSPREAQEEFSLGSPLRQGSYLLGQLLMTPAVGDSRPLGAGEIQELHDLLEQASDLYPLLFHPTEAELENLSEEERTHFAVAGPAFLGHFFQGVLATGDQVLARARAYFTPFDDELLAVVGISATQAIAVTEWLGAQGQDKLDRWVSGAQVARTLWERSVAEDWSLDRSKAEVDESGAEFPDPLSVSLGDIIDAFGEAVANSFWSLVTGYRGETGASGFTFFTEANPYDYYPLIGIDADEAYCPLINNVGLALIRNFSRVLVADPDTENRFYRRRDKVLENHTEELLRSFVGGNGEVYSSLVETRDGHFEHDVIVVCEGAVLAIEAKATPPDEPFRDTQRSFTRLRRAFRGDGGIQKAYEQAMRVVEPLNSGRSLQLFDASGEPVLTLDPEQIQEAWPICVTADSWGSLATDVSLLVEKDTDAPFPWAVNVFDLEAFLDALTLKGWGPKQLVDFVRQRSDQHGALVAGDELEIAGMYFRHGRLPEVPSGAIMPVDPQYSDIFDDIYYWRKGARDHPDLSTKEEIVQTDATDVFRELLASRRRSAEQLDAVAARSKPEPGRNDPCHCGSGIKFKRCHGRPH